MASCHTHAACYGIFSHGWHGTHRTFLQRKDFHGWHGSTQIVRCAVLSQNTQNSQNLSAWVWQGCHTLLHLCASVLICGRFFSVRSFRVFRAFCGNFFSPTDFTDLHRYLGCAVLPQNSQNLVAWVWQGCHTLLICEHLCSSVGGSSLPEVSVSSVRSVGISFLPRISQIYTDTYGALFSHRIHRIHSKFAEECDAVA